MKKYIIGIDEVGRGCLAGPVTVVALATMGNSKFHPPAGGPKLPLRDSKRLSQKQREEWFKYVKSRRDIFYAIKSISPKIIDKINISQAANLAASRALSGVYKLIGYESVSSVFLDGGLYVNKKIITSLKTSAEGGSASGGKNLKLETIIKGDEKIPVIALASIMAKVHRDRKMKNFHKKYPEYGFNEHKGYGTRKHIKAIKKHGLSKIHRKSFKLK